MSKDKTVWDAGRELSGYRDGIEQELESLRAKLEESERSVAELRKMITYQRNGKDIRDLYDKLDIAVKALEFYAEGPPYLGEEPDTLDQGEIARKALLQITERSK